MSLACYKGGEVHGVKLIQERTKNFSYELPEVPTTIATLRASKSMTELIYLFYEI